MHLTELVPEKHVILHKRLRNLRKESNRMKRREAEEEDLDSSNEDLRNDLASEKAPTRYVAITFFS